LREDKKAALGQALAYLHPPRGLCLADNHSMPAPLPTSTTAAAPWTCPFCPLLCDGFVPQAEPATQKLVLSGSDCSRARAALARFGASASTTSAQVNGQPVSIDRAIAAAAAVLAASRQPLFGGLGTDVAGARALYRLACETGAICDAAHGRALMHGLRALQDRGAFTTTFAEVRSRADLIVCLTGSPTERQPEFYRRCGVGEATPQGAPLARHLVVLGSAPVDAERALPKGLPGITTEAVSWHGDLFTTVSVLAALVAGRAVRNAPAGLAALAARLLAARYAVIVWEAAALPAQGALVVEGINTVVGTLNRSTRAASFPLGGGDGAATVNQVFSWLGGLPLRSRLGPSGLEHEPLLFDTARLLADGAVDALLWVASFGTEPAMPPAKLPRVVLGHPDAAPASDGETVFIPVSTPGIGSAGHLFRTDGVVLMPLSAVYADSLPTVADVVLRLTTAVQALRSPPGVAA
jgi:formylmethanofuran dehydrogenase subunit B